jgi:hypothetical protein
MNELTNKKQLYKNFAKAQNGFITSMSKGIQFAFTMGEILLEVKQITPHGQFESVVKNELQFAFGTRQAQKFMKIAENKTLALVVSEGEFLSINDMTKAISEATPEQIERAKEIDAANALSKIEPPKDESIIEGEFTEIKPTAPQVTAKPIPPGVPESTILEVKSHDIKLSDGTVVTLPNGEKAKIIQMDTGIGSFDEYFQELPSITNPDTGEELNEWASSEPNKVDELNAIIDELQAINTDMQADMASMVKAFESDDKIAEALAEAKKYREMNRILEERVRGLQNQLNETMRSVKYWKRRAEKIEKDVADGAIII